MTRAHAQPQACPDWQADAPPELISLLQREALAELAAVFDYRGGELLGKPGLGQRRRVRLSLPDQAGRPVRLYLKRYGQQGLGQRLWRLLTGRGRHSRAQVELDNIRRVRQAGVATMQAVSAGQECDRLGERRSYLIVTAVPGESLEKGFAAYLQRHSLDGPAVDSFNAALVQLARSLHAAGLVHRDLYACHVFLDESAGRSKLYLIDLARVFRPARWRLFRWRVKDLAQLRSSMPQEWVRRHWRHFLKQYLGTAEAARLAAFERAVAKKAAWIARRAARHCAGDRGADSARSAAR